MASLTARQKHCRLRKASVPSRRKKQGTSNCSMSVDCSPCSAGFDFRPMENPGSKDPTILMPPHDDKPCLPNPTDSLACLGAEPFSHGSQDQSSDDSELSCCTSSSLSSHSMASSTVFSRVKVRMRLSKPSLFSSWVRLWQPGQIWLQEAAH